MMEYTDIGTLKYLYLDEIEITNGTDADSFLIEATAKLYLRNAYHCYTRWGAKAKVKQLEG